MLLMTSFIIISLFSIIFAFRRLYRPGISKELQVIFIKRHMTYVFLFTLLWLLQLLNAYNQILSVPKHENDENGYVYIPSALGMTSQANIDIEDKVSHVKLTVFQYISYIASMSTGIFMLGARLMEPYFWFVFKKAILYCYGTPYTEEELKRKESKFTDTTSAFLQSSLNVELVHILLKCISEKCSEKLDPRTESRNEVFDTDYEFKREFMLHQIKIENAREWNLLNQQSIIGYQSLDEQSDEEEKGRDTLRTHESNMNTVTINQAIEIIELAPKVFKEIRKKEGFVEDTVKQSLDPNKNKEAVFKAGEGQGKSGSFFFFSFDKKFIIKTMDDSEYKSFVRMFKQYTKRIWTSNDSLLARIYGIYTVKMENVIPVHCLLMGSTISPTENGKNMLIT